MPIRRRQKSSSGYYHVIVKGINKEKIFNQQREKIQFKSIILKQLPKFQIGIYSYCIMSNHAHFIIWAELSDLSRFMSMILAEYASYYNFKHNRNGHVFQNRFVSECIEDEGYFWSCLRYIHLNPVKAQMVKRPELYKYSSMGEYVFHTPIMIHENAFEVLKMRFSTDDEFVEFHHAKQMEVFRDIKEEVNLQQEETAYYLAEELQKMKKLPLVCQIVEEKNHREEYIDVLMKKLKISKTKATKLCLKIKNRIENE